MPRPLAPQQPEFSRPVEVDQVGAEGLSFEIAAEPVEREELAKRFGLTGLDRLTASVRVRPVSRRLFRVEGHFEAEVVQSCVVTLEPIPARLAESFSALFGEGGPGLEALAAGDDDVPEAIEGGTVDIGETVAQHLALALDPYPRKPGASVPREYSGDEEEGREEAHRGPFAKLASLKRPRKR